MPISLGDKLKEARLRMGYSEKEASEETRIPVPMIAAFEAEDFLHTGAYVYASGFLKRYCMFLGLDAAPYLEAFRVHTAGEVMRQPVVARKNLIPLFLFRFRSPAFLGVCAMVLLLAAYFSINLMVSYSSPPLSFSDSGANLETSERVYTFQGRTHPEVDLTMNGRIVYLNESGEFQERVLLAGGLNTFEFMAKNKFGKITKIIRYIIRK